MLEDGGDHGEEHLRCRLQGHARGRQPHRHQAAQGEDLRGPQGVRGRGGRAWQDPPSQPARAQGVLPRAQRGEAARLRLHANRKPLRVTARQGQHSIFLLVKFQWRKGELKKKIMCCLYKGQ